MAKKDTGKLILAITIIAVALIVAPNLDFSTTVNQEIIEQLETEADGTCSLSLSKNVINSGDIITGNIKDGADTLCSIYGNLDNTGWKNIGEGTTNALGKLSITDTLNIPGTFEFRAICGSCVTNIANLVVNPITTIDCTDSDAISKMTAGWVIADGVYYYDSCVDNVVTEYYCDNGVQTRDLPCDAGYECVFTRSGAYCDLIPTWSDGDVVGSDSGNSVTSLPHNTFEIDLSENFVPGGTCGLMATISAGWTYGNQNCQGVQGSEGIIWTFHDSDSIEWSRVDTSPTYLGHSTDCILDYDGTPFKLTMEKILGMPECEIDYEYEVQVLACNC